MNILSLFDGMSGGQIAFDKLGIKFDGKEHKYFASEIKKNGIKVTKHNYPNTIHIGDVTKVSYKDGVLYTENGEFKTKIDMVIGGSPCFTAGTLVLTDKGYKNIEDIVSGDMVLTHTNTYKKVVVPMRKIADHVYRLKTLCSEDLLVTEEHPFYVKEKLKSGRFSKPKWVAAKDLNSNHLIGIARNQRAIIPYFENPIINEQIYSSNLWWLAGLFFKAGTLEDEKIVIPCELDPFKNIIEEIVEHGFSFYYENGNINIPIIGMEDFFKMFLDENSNKDINGKIINLPKYVIEWFFEGMNSATYNENDFIFNKKSAYGISQLYAKLGIRKVEVRKKGDAYFPTVYFTFDKNEEIITKFAHDICWQQIESIEKEEYNGTVYNMEVEQDHSYTVNNIIVHNCQDFSLLKASKKYKYGLEGDKSRLFYEYLRLLKEINPKYFLLENVKMKKDSEQQLNQYLGVEGIHINSKLVSFQNRPRIYWTNIPNVTIPEDRNISFQDFKETDPAICRQYKLNPTPSRIKMWNNGKGNTGLGTCANVTYSDKVYCLTRKQDRSPNSGLIEFEDFARYLTRKELELAQTIPVGYTDILPYGAVQDLCGDGWTIDVISHILSHADFKEFGINIKQVI